MINRHLGGDFLVIFSFCTKEANPKKWTHWGPYKWPEINEQLGVLHPYKWSHIFLLATAAVLKMHDSQVRTFGSRCFNK